MVFSEVDTNFTSSFYKINQPCKIIILLSCIFSLISVSASCSFLKYLNWYRSGLVLDYSLSVPYLDTKNVHIKVFILDMHFNLDWIGSDYSASSSEFVIAFVSWNAGKVPNFSHLIEGTKGRLTSRWVAWFIKNKLILA